MVKFFRYLMIIVVTLIFTNLIMIPYLEPAMIYDPPTYGIMETPKDFNLTYEDIYIKTPDGKKINAWFVPAKAAKKVFLVFHGNGSNLGDQLDWIRLYHVIGANVFIFDYHGYGKSEGTPSEANLYMDSQAAYDYLVTVKKFAPSQIILVGSSLGGAVAIDLASKRRVGGLVVRSTFTSIANAAVVINPFYRWPIVWFNSKYESLAKIGRVNCPTIIFHSLEDERFPFEMAASLFKKAPYPKRLVLIDKSEHDYFYLDSQYVNGLKWIMHPVD